jgi:hypothetical protein
LNFTYKLFALVNSNIEIVLLAFVDNSVSVVLLGLSDASATYILTAINTLQGALMGVMATNVCSRNVFLADKCHQGVILGFRILLLLFVTDWTFFAMFSFFNKTIQLF